MLAQMFAERIVDCNGDRLTGRRTISPPMCDQNLREEDWSATIKGRRRSS
jgi:hypothetical protein